MADSSYSLADLRAAMGSNDGWGNGNCGWDFILLLFLFFMGRGNLWGGDGVKATEDIATQASVNNLSSKVDTQEVLNAIRGNRDAIAGLASSLCASTHDVEQAICGVRSAVDACCCQTNLSICQLGNAVERGDANIISTLQSCCCDIKTQMLQGFNTITNGLSNLGFAMQTGFGTINNKVDVGFERLNTSIAQAVNNLTVTNERNKDEILKWLTNDKLVEKTEEIAALRNEKSTTQILAAIQGRSCGCGSPCSPCNGCL